MNSMSKSSSLPIHKMLSSSCSRGLGAHVASPPKTSKWGNKESESIVQVNSPAYLKSAFGFDKCYVETRGNQILAVAGTKKLLMEEKLRQGLMSLNVPLNK